MTINTSANGVGKSGFDEFLQFVNSGDIDEETETAPSSVKIVAASTAVSLDNNDVEAGATGGANVKKSSVGHSSHRSSRRTSGLSRRASTTEERRNPFANREGNSLIWKDVNMTLVSSAQLKFRQIWCAIAVCHCSCLNIVLFLLCTYA